MLINMKGYTFYKLISEIVQEHFDMTKPVDGNLNYLWYMYKSGSKEGIYKPFILMAEMELLKEMGYISEEEVENMARMMESEDDENITLVWMAINTWRLTRIKEHGLYKDNPLAYKQISKDYPVKILSLDLFTKAKNK